MFGLDAATSDAVENAIAELRAGEDPNIWCDELETVLNRKTRHYIEWRFEAAANALAEQTHVLDLSSDVEGWAYDDADALAEHRFGHDRFVLIFQVFAVGA